MRLTAYYLLLLTGFIIWLQACQVEQTDQSKTQAKAEVDTEVDTLDCENLYDTAYAQWMSDKARQIDDYFSAKHKVGLFNGTILFADGGNVIIKKAYGFANFREDDSLTVNSAFQLASVTKPLTALAIIWLKERGLISYDDSVQHFFPDFPYEGITVRMLLTHRSGLPNYMYFADEHWLDRQVPISNDDVLCLMKTYEPNIYYIPDYRYNYCNTNYSLLASIIEQVSDMSFGDFMKAYIFDSIGMDDSYVYSKASNPGIEHSTTGYDRRRVAEDTYLNGVTGDKGIYASVEDLFKLDQALYKESFLSQESLTEAYLAAHPELYAHDNYGLGWRINEQPDCSKIVFHSGWWKGYRTHFIRLLDKKQTIIVLANTNRSKYVSTRDLLELMDA